MSITAAAPTRMVLLTIRACSLLCHRLEAYLFTTTLEHLNRDNRVPPDEEFGGGKLPADLLRAAGDRTKLLNRVGPEPETHASFPDDGSRYGPPTRIVRWLGADNQPCLVVAEPDGNFLRFLVHLLRVGYGPEKNLSRRRRG